jgi:hypothetical protein
MSRKADEYRGELLKKNLPHVIRIHNDLFPDTFEGIAFFIIDLTDTLGKAISREVSKAFSNITTKPNIFHNVDRNIMIAPCEFRTYLIIMNGLKDLLNLPEVDYLKVSGKVPICVIAAGSLAVFNDDYFETENGNYTLTT